MRLTSCIIFLTAIVVCVLIIGPNASEASKKHKLKIAKKVAGLLFLTPSKKFIIPLPLPLPLPIPIFKSHQPIIVHEPFLPIYGGGLGLKGGLGGFGGFGGFGGLGGLGGLGGGLY